MCVLMSVYMCVCVLCVCVCVLMSVYMCVCVLCVCVCVHACVCRVSACDKSSSDAFLNVWLLYTSCKSCTHVTN